MGLLDTNTPGGILKPSLYEKSGSSVSGLFQNPDFLQALTSFGAGLGQSNSRGESLGAGISRGAMGFQQTLQSAKDRADLQKRQELEDALKMGRFDLSKKQLDQQINQADRMYGLQERQFGLQEREFGLKSQQEASKLQALRGLLGDDPQAISAVLAGAPIKDVLASKGILGDPNAPPMYNSGQTVPYGNRADGTPKGSGFLGELKRPDGSVSTEISIGVNIDGKEVEIPTLVPTLNEDEKQLLLSGAAPTEEIVKKAVEHAKGRISSGKSPFAESSVPTGGGVTKDGKPYAYDETGKPLVGVSPVPGYSVAAGAVPTAKDAETLKALDVSKKTIATLLKKYDDAVATYGSEYSGDGALLIDGLKTDINLELKNLNELGALAGPDVNILNQQLYNPTSTGANVRGLLGIVPGVSSPTDLAKSTSKRLKDTLEEKIKNKQSTSGYKSISTGGNNADPLGIR